jgi:formate dehydrogenase gamma subunit
MSSSPSKPPPAEPTPDTVIRHHWLRRVEHWVVALIFIVLTITGLAQRYHGAGWSTWVIAQLGGIDSTRLLHRYCGLSFTLAFLVHLLVAVIGVTRWRWQPSMLINRKDFRDAIHNIKYYLLLRDRPARCDRYDYRSKFEYWGIVLGGILMVLSGFILWFPVWFFQTLSFLPGEVIPAAKTIHSNEALLALTVLVVWHVYNSVFSPEVFPLDKSIITGRISRERIQHEHPLEYERLTGESAEHG